MVPYGNAVINESSAVINPALNACMCRLLKGLEELNACFPNEGVVASLMLTVDNTVRFT